ncbi:hypothetical protein KJA17_00630 [Patescibacteria group bacterium]|nr:hypothetical protein [Patescibacteria group bacterium]
MHFIVEPAKKVTVGLYGYLGGDPEIPDKRYPAIILSYSKEGAERLLRFVKKAKITPDEAKVIFNKRKKWVKKEGFVDVQVILEIRRGKNYWTITGEAEMEKEAIEVFKKDYKKCGYFVLSLGYGGIPNRKSVLTPQWKLVLKRYTEIS